MLEKLRWTVETVRFLENFGLGLITGNQVANQMKNLASRATIYRWLKLAEKNNLVAYNPEDYRDGWCITREGYDFLEAWNELPF